MSTNATRRPEPKPSDAACRPAGGKAPAQDIQKLHPAPTEDNRMSRSHSAPRSRVRQWCRQFCGMLSPFPRDPADFVDGSLINADDTLRKPASWYLSQPEYVDVNAEGYV